MITEEQMRAIVQHHLEGTRHFLVDVEVRSGDKVVVEVDDPQAITLEQLVLLNRAIRAELDEQGLDCELQVSSPGMGRPFKVPAQYTKHTGRLVVVKLEDGRTLEGRMEGDGQGFSSPPAGDPEQSERQSGQNGRQRAGAPLGRDPIHTSQLKVQLTVP
ncbi:MAG: ribosome assembly cofactor RimP [Flavobacteriales bacterium]|nr:ribosome assembly cofactor RimP [Flavobacteriales bacterium]